MAASSVSYAQEEATARMRVSLDPNPNSTPEYPKIESIVISSTYLIVEKFLDAIHSNAFAPVIISRPATHTPRPS